jgi:RNA polymerase-binding transcription factor DksA
VLHLGSTFVTDLESMSGQSDEPSSPVGAEQQVSPESVAARSAAGGELIDLDQIAADLADVEVALARLDAGTYWSDEVTGEPLSDELMTAHPLARRAAKA